MSLEFKQVYQRLMEPVQVTPEMRARILNNLEQADWTSKRTAKILRFPNWKQVTALAACLALLIAGTMFYQSGNQLPSAQQETEQPLTDAYNGIVEVDTLDTLCQAVGFSVKPLTWLPFQPESTAYTAYWGELAEITYTGQGQSATYRMAAGSDDVSGDYTVYEAQSELTVNGQTVTLKGGADGYLLALWTDEGYTYSISLSEPATQETWTQILMGIES